MMTLAITLEHRIPAYNPKSGKVSQVHPISSPPPPPSAPRRGGRGGKGRERGSEVEGERTLSVGSRWGDHPNPPWKRLKRVDLF